MIFAGVTTIPVLGAQPNEKYCFLHGVSQISVSQAHSSMMSSPILATSKEIFRAG